VVQDLHCKRVTRGPPGGPCLGAAGHAGDRVESVL